MSLRTSRHGLLLTASSLPSSSTHTLTTNGIIEPFMSYTATAPCISRLVIPVLCYSSSLRSATLSHRKQEILHRPQRLVELYISAITSVHNFSASLMFPMMSRNNHGMHYCSACLEPVPLVATSAAIK